MTYSFSDYTNVKKELGNVLWYLNTLALSLGFTLEEVAHLNVDKLRKRHQPQAD